jgi:hypothetical protein
MRTANPFTSRSAETSGLSTVSSSRAAPVRSADSSADLGVTRFVLVAALFVNNMYHTREKKLRANLQFSYDSP